MSATEIDRGPADEWYCENPVDAEAECTRIRQMLEQREQALGPMSNAIDTWIDDGIGRYF